MDRKKLPPQKLRAKQVAQRYSIRLSTVWAYAKQGKLTPIKVSDKVTVFDVAECDKLFSSDVA
jgi:predicted site-specific integrase-resolvase